MLRVSVLRAEGLGTSDSRDGTKSKRQESFLTFLYPWRFDLFFSPHTLISSENSNSEISALLHEKDCPFIFSPHLLTRVSSMLLVILRLSILYIGHSALSNIDRQRRANLGFKIRSILERQAH